MDLLGIDFQVNSFRKDAISSRDGIWGDENYSILEVFVHEKNAAFVPMSAPTGRYIPAQGEALGSLLLILSPERA